MIRALLCSRKRVFPLAAASAAMLLVSIGCNSGDSGVANTASAVQVQTVAASRQTIHNIVTAQGLVYPIHQASITPKITAPVQRFYVNRGSRVRAGELLATLDNQDLAASLVSAKGAYDQALANYESTTSSALPEEIQTAETNLENAKSNLQAQQRLYDSESRLYQQGAIARNILDATGVALLGNPDWRWLGMRPGAVFPLQLGAVLLGATVALKPSLAPILLLPAVLRRWPEFRAGIYGAAGASLLGVAIAGLVVLVFPGLAAPPLWGAALMLGAGVGWGVYSLRGRGAGNPIRVTAGNFLRTVPIAILLGIVMAGQASFDAAGVG